MKSRVMLSLVVVAVGLAAVGSLAIADASKDAQQAPAGLPPDFKLPPGMTMEDFQACILAATPGKEHKHLVEGAGVWNGKTTMYMPGQEPQKSECVSTAT